MNLFYAELMRERAALAESEERFRLMIDTAPVMVWISGADALCNFFNQPWLDFTGRTMEQELGDGWSEGVHPEDYQRCLDTYLAAFAARENFSLEYRLRRSDGEYRWVLDKGIPRFTPAGFAGYIGSCIDITERKRSEAALVEKESRLREAQAIARVGSFHWDVGANTVAWSDELCRIYGLEPGESGITYETYLEQVHPDHREQVRRAVERAVAKREPFEHEYRIVRPTGETRWVFAHGRPVVDAGGNLIALQGICQDITERKRVKESLRESEMRNRAMLRAIPDWMFLMSKDGVYLDYHAKDPDELFVPPEQFLGKNMRDVLPPEITAPAARCFEQAVESGDPCLFEYSLPNPEGDRYYEARVVSCDHDKVLSIVRDITERKQAEERFLKAFRSSPLPMAITTLKEGRFIDINESYVEMSGYAREELIGHTVIELNIWEKPEARAEFIAALEEQGAARNVEIKFRTKGGELRDLLASVEQIELGGQRCTLFAVNDITERKRAEQALRESEERFSKAFHSSPQPMSLTTLEEGQYVNVNERFVEVSGYTREEVIGRTSFDLNIWESPEARDEIVRPVKELGRARNVETKLRTKGGEFRVLLSSVELMELDGRQCLLFASSDITERKRTEAANLRRVALRADVSAALAEREGALQSILQQCAEAVVRHLDAAFARIWTLNHKERVLELQASAGLYTHLNGKHSRVRVGELKIGLIAEERQPHLTNDVGNDPRVNDRQWARDQGMVAFAGYPLLVEDRVVGVMAIFARHQLTEDALEALATVAAPIAQGIERKRAEQALRESEERFRQLAENIGAAFFITEGFSETSPGRVTYVSPAYEKIWGRSRESVYQDTRSWLDAVHSEDRERVLAALHSVGQAQFDEEFRIVRPDGEVRWVHDRVFPIWDENGEIYRTAGIVEDITERKQIEEALRESEERARRTLVEQMLAGVAECDANRKFVLANQRFCEITGYTEAELLEMRVDDITHPDDLPRAAELHHRLMETGESFVFEKRYRRKGGSEVWVNANVSPIRSGRSGGEEAVSVVIDITDRKRAEREREQLLKEAQAANRSKDEFLAVVSHELRSPLNAILGYTRLLRAGAMDAAELQETVEIIERNGRMQLQLIEDLLDSARIISGKLKLEVEPVSLTSVLTGALDVVRPAAKAKGIEIRSDLEPLAGQITGDPNRLQQVVWNLLSNAIKFTPQSGRVELRMEKVDHQVRITVKDTGKGIEPEFLPFVFDRFRQSDSSSARRFGGLGLGLSLVKQLVELHGGTIEAASEGPGCGATFTVTLPQHAARSETFIPQPPRAVAAREERMEDAIQLDQVPSLAGVRVLVVDDEEEARSLLTATLGECGAQVMAVSSGVEALAILADPPGGQRPDALILDINMPDEDGYQALERVRALETERGVAPSARIPAIALTAMGRTEDRLKALAAGFRMHVVKPVEPTELAVVIASLVERLSIGRSV